jgi:hypothetical protein
MCIIAWILFGIIAGWLPGMVMGGRRGLLGNVSPGIAGASRPRLRRYRSGSFGVSASARPDHRGSRPHRAARHDYLSHRADQTDSTSSPCSTADCVRQIARQDGLATAAASLLLSLEPGDQVVNAGAVLEAPHGARQEPAGDILASSASTAGGSHARRWPRPSAPKSMAQPRAKKRIDDDLRVRLQ